MFNWHQHYWSERERIFTGRSTLPAHEYSGPSGMLERLMFGVTTIIDECNRPDCRKVRTTTVLGDARKAS